ncbi:glycoside hydrolase [Thraustotheca clavata]|uniref:glucan endo-1,3-beta-D-glucosidase n=1 Tax=Thraustotheca clavata TaxID=74557 RepID=A0A1V9YHG9_9STRA|nr:glycoside hydrolase [Thraustotheca clavata]
MCFIPEKHLLGTMKFGLFLAACLAAVQAAITVPGINYNPRIGPNWGPDSTNCKSASQILADFQILAKITKGVRIYSITDCNQAQLVIPAAKSAGLKVWLGVWVGPDSSTFAAEKAKLSSLIQSGVVDSSILGIHVGSEAVYRKDVTPEQAIAYYQDIKNLFTTAGIKTLVTIADIGDTWIANPSMVEAVDIVSANEFPFWENKDASEAASWFYMRMGPLIASAAKYKKQILISETGWATDGSAVNTGPATPAQAAKYFNDFQLLATQMNWNYFYFSSFDMAFNSNASITNNVEEHFGLYYANGTMKPCYAELTVSGSSSVTTLAPSQLATATLAPVPTMPKNDPISPVSNSTKVASPTKSPSSTSAPGTTTSSSSKSSATSSPTTASSTAGSGKANVKSGASTIAVSGVVSMLLASIVMTIM